MASFFTMGESKIRPGVYYRYENYETAPVTGADDGKCACVLRSNWGPLDQAVLLNSTTEIGDYFGSGDEKSTLDVPKEQFYGGAKSVRALRLGTGGAYSSAVLLDDEGVEAIRFVGKYVGSRELTLTLRPTLQASYNTVWTSYEDLEELDYELVEDETYEELEAIDYADDALYELLVLEGTTQLERLTFTNATGEKEGWDVVSAVAGSNYVTATTLNVTESRLATVSQEPLLGGSDPIVDVNSYANAFEVLETYRWSVLALDTEDVSICQMMQLFLNRIYEDGKFVVGVVGDTTAVPFETRIARASGYNDYQMVYVGSGFYDQVGTSYEGYLAAARVAGMVAGTPSNQSITHSSISGATDLMEYLTTAQYEAAISAGMLTFSLSSSSTVWVEQGINTLVSLEDNMDNGWKKIKRTKVRFELMQRLNDTVENLVGKISNNEDGRMTVVQMCNSVCNSMVAEGKLLTGAKVELDDNTASEGDSASFVVYADDVDSMEKLYFGFMFRFAQES